MKRNRFTAKDPNAALPKGQAEQPARAPRYLVRQPTGRQFSCAAALPPRPCGRGRASAALPRRSGSPGRERATARCESRGRGRSARSAASKRSPGSAIEGQEVGAGSRSPAAGLRRRSSARTRNRWGPPLWRAPVLFCYRSDRRASSCLTRPFSRSPRGCRSRSARCRLPGDAGRPRYVPPAAPVRRLVLCR